MSAQGRAPNFGEAEQRLAEAEPRQKEAEQNPPERYPSFSLPRIEPFQWVAVTIRRKWPCAPFLAAAGAQCAGRFPATAGSIARVSDFRKDKSRSYRVGCCGEEWEHGGGGGRRHQGVMAGLVRPSTRPSASRRQARKALRRPPSCRSRRGGTVRGGPAWMAGTSPAMTARVRRTNSKPVDQQITP